MKSVEDLSDNVCSFESLRTLPRQFSTLLLVYVLCIRCLIVLRYQIESHDLEVQHASHITAVIGALPPAVFCRLL